MTFLGFVNRVFFQWFFVRLAKEVEDGKVIKWKFLTGVVPLTGWGTDFKYIKNGD